MDRLKVWKNSRAVGYLYYGTDFFEFNYNDDATEKDAISLTMPVSEQPIQTQILPPVFLQNLPEGMLEDALIKTFGKLVDLSTDISMLKFTGRYKTNFLQITDEDQEPTDSPWDSIESFIKNPNSSSINLFKDCVEKLGPASGISGVQPKVAANLHKFKEKKSPTLRTDSYILKFHDDREYFGLVINEYFCLKVAEYAGIPCAESEIIENGNCLAVHRFDKKNEKELFCMEDFCTLQFLPPRARYNGDYYDLITVLRNFVPPSMIEVTMKELFKVVALSMKIKNGDAHLKNFSLIYDDDKNIHLAKAYDQVCTTVYVPKDLPALEFNGKNDWPTNKELIKFAEKCEIKNEEANSIIKTIDDAKMKVLPELKDYCNKNKQFSNVYEKINDAWKN